MKIEVGKKYELNNGEVHRCYCMCGNDPLLVDCYGYGPFVIDGVLYHQDGRVGDFCSDHEYSVKREWTEPETGTLAELDAKPGDVVAFVKGNDAHPHLASTYGGFQYTINENGAPKSNEEGSGGGWSRNCVHIFRIISRASEAPKAWGEMSDEERKEVSFYAMSGECVQLLAEWPGQSAWLEWDRKTPLCELHQKIRIKPSPVRETVTLYGGAGYGLGYEFDRNLTEHCSHRLIFTTTDGKPATGLFRNENGDVIIMEEM